MAGVSFTSLYDEEVDVDLGHGFSCTLKKYLSESDFREASHALIRNRKYNESGTTTTVTGDFDPFEYNRVLVSNALVNWNLTKDNPSKGDPVPIPISDYKRGKYDLPQPVFRVILARVLELNNEVDEVSPQDDATFRDPDTGSTS